MRDDPLGFTLEELDEDGALLDGAAAVFGSSRADLLRKAAFGGAALLFGLSAPAAAATGPKSDTAIVNFDLVFESCSRPSTSAQ